MERQPIVGGRSRGRVLLADDEAGVRAALEQAGHEVVFARNSSEALACLANTSTLDAVVVDIRTAGIGGLELLRIAREYDLELPVILVAAIPDVARAIEALDYGAYKYLPKPVDIPALRETVRRAVALRRMARLNREALTLVGSATMKVADRAGLDKSFARALRTFWMAYQPVVRAADGTVFGYEALLRSEEPALPNPGALVDAAARLGQLNELGRAIRSTAAKPMPGAPEAVLFLNLHPNDLADPMLVAEDTPLTQIASKVVLEITERTAIDGIPDLRSRVARMRELGFRMAVDDLGGGYAGLTSLAILEPEMVKLDISLVRGIDGDPVKRKVIEGMTALAHELNAIVVAEGVETTEERDALCEVGCDLMQGYLFAKPGRAFPLAVWPRATDTGRQRSRS
jgi:EAL domain-containing protein (putative c-di-GMP-specific phosphodiesterase class I)